MEIDFSKEQFIETLANLRDQAQQTGALNTAVSAQVALGKVLGYDNSGPMGASLQNMSLEELLDHMVSIMARDIHGFESLLERARAKAVADEPKLPKKRGAHRGR
jgi:hypothetical protein